MMKLGELVDILTEIRRQHGEDILVALNLPVPGGGSVSSLLCMVDGCVIPGRELRAVALMAMRNPPSVGSRDTAGAMTRGFQMPPLETWPPYPRPN